MNRDEHGAEPADWFGGRALWETYHADVLTGDVVDVPDIPQVRHLLRNLSPAELDRLGAAAYVLHGLCEIAMDELGGFSD